MCNFEKHEFTDVRWFLKNGHLFNIVWKQYPKYPTARAPWGPGVGMLVICSNYAENVSVVHKSPNICTSMFFKIAHLQFFQSFNICKGTQNANALGKLGCLKVRGTLRWPNLGESSEVGNLLSRSFPACCAEQHLYITRPQPIRVRVIYGYIWIWGHIIWQYRPI